MTEVERVRQVCVACREAGCLFRSWDGVLGAGIADYVLPPREMSLVEAGREVREQREGAESEDAEEHEHGDDDPIQLLAPTLLTHQQQQQQAASRAYAPGLILIFSSDTPPPPGPPPLQLLCSAPGPAASHPASDPVGSTTLTPCQGPIHPPYLLPRTPLPPPGAGWCIWLLKRHDGPSNPLEAAAPLLGPSRSDPGPADQRSQTMDSAPMVSTARPESLPDSPKPFHPSSHLSAAPAPMDSREDGLLHAVDRLKAVGAPPMTPWRSLISMAITFIRFDHTSNRHRPSSVE